jgi:hypothetical protein
MTTPFAESRSGRLLWRHASHLHEARCDAKTILGPRLIVGYSEVGQRPVAAQSAVVVEYDVPGERRRSRICIERCRHLKSIRVSVDAVLERDGRQLDTREHQVNAAVAEDDHCEASRWRDLWLRHHVDVQNPRASNRVRRRVQDLTLTGDELAVRKAASVVLRRLERGHAKR